VNAAGLALLKEFEGWRSRAYADPGTRGDPYTIGYGFTRDVNPGDEMTLEQGAARLEYEVAHFEQGVTRLAPIGNENQLAAMVCLAYNIGLSNFRNSSVLRDHNNGDIDGAADAILMWDKSAGRRMPGLSRRREAERKLYLTP
jgi:lysozyme